MWAPSFGPKPGRCAETAHPNPKTFRGDMTRSARRLLEQSQKSGVAGGHGQAGADLLERLVLVPLAQRLARLLDLVLHEEGDLRVLDQGAGLGVARVAAEHDPGLGQRRAVAAAVEEVVGPLQPRGIAARPRLGLGRCFRWARG